MKLCEYVDNLLSLTSLTQAGGHVRTEFVEHRAIHKYDMVSFSISPGINFTLKAEKARASPLSRSNIMDAEFANKMIRKYGIIPMGMIIFVGYRPGEILLREIIRASDPYMITLEFGD
jgi:hypothetical protein